MYISQQVSNLGGLGTALHYSPSLRLPPSSLSRHSSASANYFFQPASSSFISPVKSLSLTESPHCHCYPAHLLPPPFNPLLATPFCSPLSSIWHWCFNSVQMHSLEGTLTYHNHPYVMMFLIYMCSSFTILSHDQYSGSKGEPH